MNCTVILHVPSCVASLRYSKSLAVQSEAGMSQWKSLLSEPQCPETFFTLKKEPSIVEKGVDPDVRLPGSKSCSCHLLAV